MTDIPSQHDGNIALTGQIIDNVHYLVARVYFADTDFSGAVYHARYLEFLERGRSDFLRCIGVYHTDLVKEDGGALYWVVRHMSIDFNASASIDDILNVKTRLVFVGGARCRMAQQIIRADQVLVEAEVTAALINDKGKPQRFPKSWKEIFTTLIPFNSKS